MNGFHLLTLPSSQGCLEIGVSGGCEAGGVLELPGSGRDPSVEFPLRLSAERPPASSNFSTWALPLSALWMEQAGL